LSDLSNFWSVGGQYITDFVSVRGGIAHNGRSAPYVNQWELVQYNDCIKLTAKEMDNQICTYVYNLVTATVQPWRRIPWQLLTKLSIGRLFRCLVLCLNSTKSNNYKVAAYNGVMYYKNYG